MATPISHISRLRDEASGLLGEGGVTTLPIDVQARARRRLRLVAIMVALTSLAFTATGFLTWSPPESGYFPPTDWGGLTYEQARLLHYALPMPMISSIFIVLGSMGVFILTREGGIADRFITPLGLVYLWWGAAWLSAQDYLHPASVIFPFMGISWAVFWIAVFPLIVPAEPRRATLAALLSAIMPPICLFAARRLWTPDTPLPDPIVAFTVLPPLAAVFWAHIGSRVIYQLNRDLKQARQLGSYQMIKPLGAGGMGEVWEAHHQMLARPAAVKLIKPERLGLASPDQQRIACLRFEREARATAALVSPHTIHVYDFGRTQDGTFYYAMELLDGLDLESLVKQHGPVEPERAVHFLIQACDALAEAHEHGLIHRDIKPANLIACSGSRREDFIKVLDFGLVRAFAHEAEDSAGQLTAEGLIPGTPAYMAPEMSLGEGAIDGRADLYALGCVGFWLLTGRTVFEAGSPMQMVVKHTTEPPEAPSTLSEMEVPDALDAVILACLDKDPDRRPATADELADRLRTIIPERGRWTSKRAKRWWQARHLTPTPMPTEVESLSDDLCANGIATTHDAVLADAGVARG